MMDRRGPVSGLQKAYNEDKTILDGKKYVLQTQKLKKNAPNSPSKWLQRE